MLVLLFKKVFGFYNEHRIKRFDPYFNIQNLQEKLKPAILLRIVSIQLILYPIINAFSI